MTKPKPRDTGDPRRIQFDLLPHRLAELDQLMEFCDLNSRKDLFDNAMTLFEWAVHEVRAGRVVASYDRAKDHVEVVRFPVLDNAARRAQAHTVLTVVDTSGNAASEQPTIVQRRTREGAGLTPVSSFKPIPAT